MAATKKRGAKKKASSLNRKLDKVLAGQRRILREEKKEEKAEEEVKELEEKQLAEIAKLEELQKEADNKIPIHPLTRVTKKDILRGSSGAFIAIFVHYTVYYGVKIAENISYTRATGIYLLSFIAGMVFLYSSGFKRIKDSKALMFLPVRVAILYIISIIISIGALYLLFPSFGTTFKDVYITTSTVSLVAVIGACTADILGKD